ncbi:hypothetical protein M406DRAFT_327013 [Cryphonectria parasitica EP155]|uniref:Uncharacterized protein n=1 Tax=Cryphonectria parasitica (strain ATCC 38755 / EP155) TaxID=660469 RepID=A0A9P4Y8A8_CRYP1|nr:uncharacterized protein M406DRAFT_327013 [Cryphonectria parasitica EP155]KAF3768586.1 hypothetical protein M406DRAFT_327013 [Cryphonectria parasitica EP155]
MGSCTPLLLLKQVEVSCQSSCLAQPLATEMMNGALVAVVDVAPTIQSDQGTERRQRSSRHPQSLYTHSGPIRDMNMDLSDEPMEPAQILSQPALSYQGRRSVLAARSQPNKDADLYRPSKPAKMYRGSR